MKKKTHEQFCMEVYNLYNDEYKILTEYKKNNIHVLVSHSICGHQWLITPANLVSGKKCPQCFGNKKKSTDDFKKDVFEFYGDEYIVLSEYKSAKDNVTICHNNESCNYYTWNVTPNNFLRNRKCPKCQKRVKNKTTEFFKNEIKDLVKEEYEVLGEYKGARKVISFKHVICSNEFKMTPDNFLRGQRCPFCSMSKGERKIKDFLEKNNITFEQEYDKFIDLISDKGNPLRFDFAVFEDQLKERLILLIEYDGEFHFNKYYPSQNFETLTYHDELKNRYCHENKIKLLRIPYSNFNNIEEILKEHLDSLRKETLGV